MTSKFEARISIDAGPNTRAIFDSIYVDNEFYPENPTKTVIRLDGTLHGTMHVEISSDHLPHLRANLNSALRLVDTCNRSIESLKI